MHKAIIGRLAVIFLALAGLAGCTNSGGGGGTSPLPSGPAATSVALTTPSTSIAGPQWTVPLTARVTASGGVVSGTVTFYDGSTVIQRDVVLVNGIASASYSTPVPGVHTFGASYEGSASFLSSTSAPLSVTLTMPTTTTLTTDTVSIPVGGSVKLTSTTTPNASGSVTFYDGATPLGSSTMVLGQSTSLAVNTLSTGTHSITARYSGDNLHEPSTSAARTVNVGTGAPTTIVLTEAATSGIVGQGVVLTATLNASATGTIFFYSGAQLLGSTSLVGGVASMAVYPTISGVNTFTAYYNGDANNLSGTSNAVSYTASQKPSLTLSLKSSAASLSLGSPLTLTATLSQVTSPLLVVFHDGYRSTYDPNYQRNVITLGPEIARANTSGGVAQINFSGLSLGSHTLAASTSPIGGTISNPVSFEVTPSTANCGLAPALYEITTGTATVSGQNLMATAPDESAVCAANSGTALTLSNPNLMVTGGASLLDNAYFFGLDSAVLAYGGSATTVSGPSINIPNGGTITTAASGASGIYATGKGSTVTASGVTVATSGDSSNAVDVSQSGAVSLTQSTLTTSGSNSVALSTEATGGTVAMNGGSAKTSGANSPAIRAAASSISVTNATVSSAQDNGAMLSGNVALTLNGSDLSGALHGVVIENKGETSLTLSVVRVTNGSITAASGDLFDISGLATVAVVLNGGTVLSTGNGNLFNVRNGAIATVTGTGQQLVGDVVCDASSYMTVALNSSATLKGALNQANTARSMTLNIDSTSTWEVTGTSYLTSIKGAVLSGSSVSNIIGNGFTVYYLSSANPSLNGATYVLGGSAGGMLKPM